jgi:hypothetical protein
MVEDSEEDLAIRHTWDDEGEELLEAPFKVFSCL